MSQAAKLSFLSGASADYMAHLYSQYLKDPAQTDPSWKSLFEALNDNEINLLKELTGASWTPTENRKSDQKFDRLATATGVTAELKQPANKNVAAPASENRQAAVDSLQALMLIRAYRDRGHLAANLDPLGLKQPEYQKELDPAFYGFTDSDYDRPIFINGVLGKDKATLREILQILRETYCGSIGVEYFHLSNPEERAWLQERVETPLSGTPFSVEDKRTILKRVTAAETLEKFLHVKYPGTKRFGIDGGEALVPALEQVMGHGATLGLKEVIVGMAHRGRLNVLTNVMGKPFTALFSEFQGKSPNPDDVQGSGDVKYHLGTSSDRDFNGNTVHLSLTPNPSHLEAVNPVVLGKVRAKQKQRGDSERTQVLPLLIHGDAAFAGQGLVAESLMISELPGYRVGGTMHIVINNQIGFTTMPQYSRSGPYCTDVAKMLSAPIFHVNGDDIEAVVHVARIATEFRQEFKKDVVIDIFCYRRFGHNEGDEPMFTQPLMYKKIKDQTSTRELYARKLAGENVVSAEEAQKMVDDFTAQLEEAFKATQSYKPNRADWLAGAWTGFKVAYGDERRGKTAIDTDMMALMEKTLTSVPEGFDINAKLARQLEAKKEMFATGTGFDWGTGENMAFASLVAEGYPVRLSGQDVGRGTFSHRHAIMYDQATEQKYIPIKALEKGDVYFDAYDSPLSEAAVLGYEYGYSMTDPASLVIWEAQFGDFANGAQVLVDQFISSAESKWLRMSGLVMLLPHGYEGQGPEHSSARLERYLQLSAEDNWQVCNCTTPANYFHMLRRQIHRDFRKPLIVMTPKSLLRHKLAVSTAADFTGDSTFHRFLWDDARDNLADPKKIRRIVLCSGKVYYDLFQERESRGLKDVMIIRVEQLYPFPSKALAEELKQYPNADIVWCQEEPKNMGAWFFVNPLIEDLLVDSKHKCKRPVFVGRPAAASPATGLLSRHNAEQAKLVDEALTVR